MSITEFAVVSLKPGIQPNDPSLQSVLKSCIETLHAAPGGANFRFLKQVHRDGSHQRICLLGGWATVSDHATFLQSGQVRELLQQLVPYVAVDVVHHVDFDVTRIRVGDDGRVEASILTLQDGKKEIFENARDKNVVGGWKLGKKDKGEFGRAIGLVRGQLHQEAVEEGGEVETQEKDIWLGFSIKGRDSMSRFREDVINLLQSVEVLEFDAIESTYLGTR